MLTLHRLSRTIVTDESFGFKLKCVNPACYMDSIPGDVGLGIEISVNEYTRAEFGNPGRFEKYITGQDRKFPGVSIRFNGALLMSGTLIITNANRETYTAWLQSELGTLGTAQRDKFITDMDWKKDVEFENKSSYIPGTDEYGIVQVENQVFWEGKGKEIEKTINFTNQNGDPDHKDEKINYLSDQFRINHAYTINRKLGGVVVETGEGCVISPYLFLRYVVKEMFRINQFFIDETDNPLNDEDFQLLVYNNYNIFRQSFTIDQTTASTWDTEINDFAEVVINEITNTDWTIGSFNYSDLLPRIALKDFVLWIQNFINVAFHFKTDGNVRIINRNTIPLAEAYSLDAYFLDFWDVGERKDVKLKFVQEYEKNDAAQSQDWHDLSDRIKDFKEPVADYASLLALPSPEMGELRKVIYENKIYEYKWAVFNQSDELRHEDQIDICEWSFVSLANQPFIYGDSDIVEEIKTGCSTLAYQYTNERPYAKQNGNIKSARSLWSDFAFRVLLNDPAEVNFAKIQFDGDEGIFNKRWKNWANFWKNRLQVKGEFMIPINELYYIINNITQPYSTRAGKFLIQEMECDFVGNQMSSVKITGYKLD